MIAEYPRRHVTSRVRRLGGGESVGGSAPLVDPPLKMRLPFGETVHFGPEVVHRSPERCHRILKPIDAPVRALDRALDEPVRAGGRADDEGCEGDGRPDDGEEFGGDVHAGECSTVSAEYLRRLAGR